MKTASILAIFGLLVLCADITNGQQDPLAQINRFLDNLLPANTPQACRDGINDCATKLVNSIEGGVTRSQLCPYMNDFFNCFYPIDACVWSHAERDEMARDFEQGLSIAGVNCEIGNGQNSVRVDTMAILTITLFVTARLLGWL